MTTTAAGTRSRRRAATTAAAAADQDDHVAAAAYLMRHAGTAAVAVLDAQRPGQPAGCITAADIAEAVAQGKDVNEIRIRELIAHRHPPAGPVPASQPPPR